MLPTYLPTHLPYFFKNVTRNTYGFPWPNNSECISTTFMVSNYNHLSMQLHIYWYIYCKFLFIYNSTSNTWHPYVGFNVYPGNVNISNNNCMHKIIFTILQFFSFSARVWKVSLFWPPDFLGWKCQTGKFTCVYIWQKFMFKSILSFYYSTCVRVVFLLLRYFYNTTTDIICTVIFDSSMFQYYFSPKFPKN